VGRLNIRVGSPCLRFPVLARLRLNSGLQVKTAAPRSAVFISSRCWIPGFGFILLSRARGIRLSFGRIPGSAYAPFLNPHSLLISALHGQIFDGLFEGCQPQLSKHNDAILERRFTRRYVLPNFRPPSPPANLFALHACLLLACAPFPRVFADFRRFS